MSNYAKAIGGALTAIVVYIVAEVGLDLPEEVVAALQLLLTGGVVWALRNREPVPPAATLESGKAKASHVRGP